MPRLFLGNFEFEHQLAAHPNTLGLRAVPRVAAELSSVWWSIAQENDVLWMPEAPDSDFPSDMAAQGFPNVRWVSSDRDLAGLEGNDALHFCPWGWSPERISWAERRDLNMDPPPLDAVRTANSRRFSFALERELNMGLEDAVQVASLAEWETAVKAFGKQSRWVIKSEFGMSARERLLGRGPHLEANQTAWAQKRFRAGQVLFLEPWVQSLGEAGLQFEVPKPGQGEPKFLGTALLLTEDSGAYRGSRFDLTPGTEPDWSQAIETGQTVAQRAQALGYFGPLGIDAMWYLDRDETPRLRPVQDINARWTMGRLSLGFRSRLASGEAGVWLHFRCPAKTPESARTWWKSLPTALPNEVRLLRTSPLTIGNLVTRHATAVLIAPDEALLGVAVQFLLTSR